MFDGLRKDVASLVEAIAGVEHKLNPQPVPAPLLDFVEVAAVGIERIVGRSWLGESRIFKKRWR